MVVQQNIEESTRLGQGLSRRRCLIYRRVGRAIFRDTQLSSESNIDAVRHYIQNQEEHHRKQTYEAEFLSFLNRSGVSFDKDQVFD